METYLISQNGRIIVRLTATFEDAFEYAENFAKQHKGDWTEIFVGSPKVRIYQRCDEAGVREVKE